MPWSSRDGSISSEAVADAKRDRHDAAAQLQWTHASPASSHDALERQLWCLVGCWTGSVSLRQRTGRMGGTSMQTERKDGATPPGA